MAKGRRLTSSRSERLLGIGNYNNYYNHVHVHDHDHNHNYNHDHGYNQNGTVPEVPEFREEDVWLMVDDTSGTYHQDNSHLNHHQSEWSSRATFESDIRQGSVRCNHEERQVGGLSLAFEDKTAPSSRRILHQYGGATGTPRVVGPSSRHMATSAPVNVPDWSKILRVNSVESMHDSDTDTRVGDDDSVMEPPHEYLARSRQKNAFSVFEGVGRTLKGRDLSRVRDAVWSQTGFEG